jgi:hypothetical protein
MEIFNKDCIIIILKYGHSTKYNGTSCFVMNETNFFFKFFLGGIIFGVKKHYQRKKKW